MDVYSDLFGHSHGDLRHLTRPLLTCQLVQVHDSDAEALQASFPPIDNSENFMLQWFVLFDRLVMLSVCGSL